MLRYATSLAWNQTAPVKTSKEELQLKRSSTYAKQLPVASTSRLETQTTEAHQLARQIVSERNLYAVLGVNRRATAAQIRSAYLRRCRICHPDKLFVFISRLESTESSSQQSILATKAFQRLSFAYETLSKPGSRRTYDLTGGHADDFEKARTSADDTLHGVLLGVLEEFWLGDFGFIHNLINTLNEHPHVAISDEHTGAIEGALYRLRELLLAGHTSISVVRFEIMRLYEVQQELRQLSYFDVSGRIRLTLLLAKITLAIPLQVDKALSQEVYIAGELEDGVEEEKTISQQQTAHFHNNKSGILPRPVAGILRMTVAILDRGDDVF